MSVDLDRPAGGQGERVSELALRKERLSTHKRALFERWVENGESVAAGSPVHRVAPLRPPARPARLPLSFAQERLWFLDQLEPGNAAYNLPVVVPLPGSLELPALRRSLGEIVRRHEALRTRFAASGGEPCQVIAPPHSPRLSAVVDLAALPRRRAEAEAMRLAQREASRSFDLARGPLLRAGLLRLSAGEHVLFATLHHIVSDGWSIGVFARELGALYRAFAAGLPSPLPELPIQYADYALWQRERLQGALLAGELAFWREQLAGAPPLLALPTDRPRPAVQSVKGAWLRRPLPAGLSRALAAFGRQRGVTPFMTFLAAFDAVLFRHGAGPDLTVGTWVANRNRPEIEGLIGFFVNTLVLRTRLSARDTVEELVANVRQVTLAAYAHEELPFERVLDELRPDRTLSHTPLFQVMMELRGGAAGALASGGSAEQPGRANFDLTLSVIDAGEEVTLALNYSADLFDRATIARLLGHFERLLHAWVAPCPARLGELPLMAPGELQQLLLEWGRGRRAGAAAEAVAARFAAQAERQPESPAVIWEGASLGYGELARRAHRLARYLRALGLGPEDRIALCVERSPAMVVGLLGILAAGAAYVPVDLAYPRERQAFLIADSGARLLLTTRRWLAELPAAGRPVLCLDEESWGTAEERLAAADGPATAAATAANAAYVIYTSGSSGRPKGVEVPRGALDRYTATVRAELGLMPRDRVLQFASPSFDTAAEEIFPCLTSGAAVVLRTDAMLASPRDFCARCREWGVTVLDLPTAYWGDLAAALDAGEAELPASVRIVLIGGEQATVETLTAWRRGAGAGVRLINTYGPTEATIVATSCELTAASTAPDAAWEVPIGSPIPEASVYVVDERQLPVPPGVAGELLIGGGGLARGYLGRPDLTAERFLPDPFGEEPGARLYRSGDLVRFASDGRLRFLGRTDRQVKVRGFRIELAEIEAALRQHPAVRAAAAGVWSGPEGEPRLHAHVVSDPGQEPTTSELRRFLKERLPDYMLPAGFTALASLPLNASGKLDSRALPPPEALRPRLEHAFVAPGTPVEEELAAIWREVLGVERVGVQDNFFELGGHSLLATQVLARLRDRLGFDLPLIALFEMPTIEELALAFEELLLDRAERLGGGEPALAV